LAASSCSGGRAADLFGRRRVFGAGLALFTLVSLVGGFAWSGGVLLAARAGQGLGAAMVAPAGLSIVATSFREGAERDRALGAWGATGASGIAAGVLLGGLLTVLLSWRWVMFVNVPVGASALAFALLLLRESHAAAKDKALDLPGAVTATGGLVALVYAITHAEISGFGSTAVLLPFGLALALIAAFVAVESRSPAPLVPLEVFASAALAGATLVGFLSHAGFGAGVFVFSLHLQQVLGYSAIGTGFAFLPLALVNILAAGLLSSWLVTRFGARTVAVAGMAALTAGLLLFAGTTAEDGAFLTTVLPASCVASVGIGLAFTSSMSAATSGREEGDQAWPRGW
jgi:MFS family permease